MPSSDEEDMFEFEDLLMTPKPLKTEMTVELAIEPNVEPNVEVAVELHEYKAEPKEKAHSNPKPLTKSGKVFLVQQKIKPEKIYAMKVLKKATIVIHGDGDGDGDEKRALAQMNERSILAQIGHPFIVKLHYAFQTTSRLYLILSLAIGGELFSILHTEKMFNDDQARFYIAELLLALEHLHGLGIIYRDLKPENVMLDGKGHLLLTDFGLSKVAVEGQTVCGTAEFMAPEVLDERVKYGKVVDFWSLGVMLFDMVVGSPPFTGGNRKKIMENVLKKKPVFPKYITQDTRDLCTKLLKKNPDVRLGAKGIDQIKNHCFFASINWKHALERKLVPPFIPNVENPLDTSNFDNAFTSMATGESLVTGMMSDGLFKGFSFVDHRESFPE